MIAILAWFITPVGRIVGMGLAAVTILGSIYWKIHSDAVSGERARVEKGNTNAITSAREARDDKRSECDRDPVGCVPDDQYRD